MSRLISRGRLVAMAIMLVVLLIVYTVTLYKLQIVEGAAYKERSQNSIVSTKQVTAARGNILDRYGRVLISNRTCNNIVLDTKELFYSGGTIAEANAVLLELAQIVADCGDSITDTLPVSKSAPFEWAYTPSIADFQRSMLGDYVEYNNTYNKSGLDENLSAVELMAFFREKYGIDPGYDSEQMRTIAGIRYEINSRTVIPTSDYIFVEDASIELITRLMESNLPGFDVEVSYVREYNTGYAAHILGYVGLMTGEEYNGTGTSGGYKDKGYPYSAEVGKDGAEYAFEDYLHGVDGEAAITRTASGIVTNTFYEKEPEPGNHVYLTIDIGLNEAAENALASRISQINAEREAAYTAELAQNGVADKPIYAKSGSVVAIDINSGEPLCIASYPTYDLRTFLDNWEELTNTENNILGNPMFNYALQGTYAPGSTFKPVTALGGLDSGIVELTTTITCTGIFDKYDSEEAGNYAPRCWIYGAGSHGDLNTAGAIEHSCNIYFYTVGDFLGIDRMGQYAAALGLGQYTGIELYEEKGYMASPEKKAELYADDPYEKGWYQGNTIAAAIGQSVSQFTPIQMANYCAAIANNGTRYETSILKTVRSYDYSETLYRREPVVLGVADYDEEYYEAIQYGMRQVAASGTSDTVYKVFQSVDYTLAAKTGTAQTGVEGANDGLFICYAPAENPEIAIAVAVEKGGSGAALAQIAKEVLDYYFTFADSSVAVEREVQLLK